MAGAAEEVFRVPPDVRGTRWCIDSAALDRVAAERAEEYRTADPFSHTVLDDLFPAAVLDEIVAEFPGASDIGWERIDDVGQRKLQWKDPSAPPPATARFLDTLESAPFLDFVERLTGVAGLIADPRRLYGGMHQIESGGFLKVHSDITLHPRLWLYRRVSLILYLNREWDDLWGGALEFWDNGMTEARKSIEPRFNRAVIFSSAPGNMHGHPEPLRCPPGITRRSLGVYYYTSPDNPNTPRGRSIGTYRPRPGETLPGDRLRLARTFVADVMPQGLARRVRRRLRNVRGRA